MIRHLAPLFWFFVAPAMVQSAPSADEFQGRVIQDPLHGSIGWHLDNVEADARGPLVVWLPGSGATPYFQSYTDGSIGFAFAP